MNMPTIWTIEFKDRSMMDIEHEDKDEARILAQAQRINGGKDYQIRAMYKRAWR